ncbi:MAG: TfpX/TfpZ family type IV pilin accessory protein [Burkholderiales bacterium]
MTLASFTRWQAFLAHLAISALIAATMVALVLALWYPPPYFAGMGGGILLRLLIGVDVVLGPLITLIVFDPRKPRLKYDLMVIAALQVAALGYGAVVMFDARPVYNVFVKDRFDVVPANRIVDTSLARAPAQFRPLPLAGPRIVGALPPTDPAEASDIALAAMHGGPDLSDLPHLYVDYAQVAPQVAATAKPLSMLSRQGRAHAEAVSDFAKAHPGAANLGFVPVKARTQDFSAIVDRKTGDIVGYLPLSPW